MALPCVHPHCDPHIPCEVVGRVLLTVELGGRGDSGWTQRASSDRVAEDLMNMQTFSIDGSRSYGSNWGG